MPDPALRRFALPGLLALAFALRLGYGLARPPQQPGQDISNSDDYVGIATAFAQTGTLRLFGEPSAYREPAYPILLGSVFKVFGRSYTAVLATNCVLAVAALAFLFLAGRELYGEGLALAAAAVAAVYPPFVFYAAQTVRETALLAFSAGALWALLRALKRPSAAAFAGAGLAGALCGLTNLTMLPFFLILAPLAIWLLNRLTAGWRWSAVYTAAFVLLYGLWPLRNFLTFGTFIPGTTLPVGSILYTYLVVPQELGGTAKEQEILDQDPVVQTARRMDAPQADRHFRRASRDWIGTHPFAYLKLVAWRFFWDEWRFWPRPQAAGRDYRLFRWIGLLFNGWIIPLGLAGMVVALFGRERLVLCLHLFVFSIVLAHSLILTMLRYRTPIMPWLILFACLAIERLWAMGRRKDLPSF